MSKFDFISNLESAPLKQKYQTFDIELGFEKVSVLVPFSKAPIFESAAQKAQPKSKASLLKLVKQYEGFEQ